MKTNRPEDGMANFGHPVKAARPEDGMANFGTVPTCRVCGCTDNHACPGGCYWVEPDLCSRCADAHQKTRNVTNDPL